MKTKNLLITWAVTGLSFAAIAQPNPLYFNTAINSALNGKVALGQAVSNWQVSVNGLNGTYVPAVRINPQQSAWYNYQDPLADWITAPHTCDLSNNTVHNCNTALADEYYKISFQLPAFICGVPITDINTYRLKIHYNADNCVFRVYVNGVSMWQNQNVQPIGSANPYTYASYNQQNTSIVPLVSGWVAGTNEVVVHVKSGHGLGAGSPDLIGFHAVVDQSYTTYMVPCPTDPCCLGNECGEPQNKLTADYEIPMDRHNFHFSGDVQASDKVNVGLDCGNLLPGKLNVTTAVPSDINGGNDSYSIYGLNTNGADQSMNTGVYGEAQVAGGEAGGNNQRGVWGTATGGIEARGVFGEAKDGFRSFGGHFQSVHPNPAGINYGVYTEAVGGNLNYGIYSDVFINHNQAGPPAADLAGYFNGDCWTTSNTWYGSDRRIKSDIRAIENPLSIINKLNPVTYSFDHSNKGLNLSYEKQYGFISQEVAEVLPELTKKAVNPAKIDKEGKEIAPETELLGVNYNGFIAILTKAIQEQQKQIEEMKSVIQSMAGGTTTRPEVSSTPVVLSDVKAIVLNQNTPNPFAESTVITYNIPEDFGKAQIVFSDVNGIVIKTVDIIRKGEGSLNVFANDLTNGSYSYSLIVDGQVVASRKMIKQ